MKLGEVDSVEIYYDHYHPEQTLTIDWDEEKGIMNRIIGPYDDITIYEGIKKTLRVSEKPDNMIGEMVRGYPKSINSGSSDY